MIKLKDLLNEGKTGNDFIDFLLTKIQPTINDIITLRKQKAEKEGERFSAFEEHLTELTLKYDLLKESAMRLGSAFQKVNFLRDLKADFEDLNRTYFPNTDLSKLDEKSKLKIIEEIEADFKAGYEGLILLPIEAKFGVYTAYSYYKKLLAKLKNTPSAEIKNTRIRVSNYQKYGLFAKCYFSYKLNII